jgi:hypothetical protein
MERDIRLSTIARDPAVAAFLARGERDDGQSLPVLPRRPKPAPTHGAVLATV